MAVDYLNALNAGSGMDTKSIVDAIVGAAKAPQQDFIDRRKDAAEVEISGLGQLKSAMQTLRSAMTALNDAREFNFSTLSNSNPDNIYANFTTGSAEAGIHELSVSQLARRDIHVSDPFASATDDQGGNVAASYTFTVGSGEAITVTLDAGEVSLSNLADAINEEAAGATARVIELGDGNYRLFVESDQSGTANAITLTTTSDPDPLGLTDAGNNVQPAQDAEFTYNGVAMSRSSNQVTDLIEGVQLDLMDDSGTSVRIEVAQDNNGAVTAIENLVAAYNAFESVAKELTSLENEAGEAGELYGDSAIRALRGQFRAMFLDEGSMAGDNITRMSDMGVTFDRYGVLKVDTILLTDALENHFDEVKTYFTANTDDQLEIGAADRGLSGDIMKMIDDYLGPGGLMITREQSNSQLLSRLEEDQTKLDSRMSDLEARTTTQFTVMNKIMDEMKSLQDYLDSQMENLPFTKKNN